MNDLEQPKRSASDSTHRLGVLVEMTTPLVIIADELSLLQNRLRQICGPGLEHVVDQLDQEPQREHKNNRDPREGPIEIQGLREELND
jgi:hypothetical protein